jgi:hypothetical protein
MVCASNLDRSKIKCLLNKKTQLDRAAALLSFAIGLDHRFFEHLGGSATCYSFTGSIGARSQYETGASYFVLGILVVGCVLLAIISLEIYSAAGGSEFFLGWFTVANWVFFVSVAILLIVDGIFLRRPSRKQL